ncbi:MAG TPA: hypothetical protein VHX14_23985 [Thermoanaerobaculia bacterium]|jgi:hypothetical protein|nr:hypothetical protein [Thermoanaerobaculia bacterium]
MKTSDKTSTEPAAPRNQFDELTEGIAAFAEARQGKRTLRRIELPTFRGQGLHPGVDLDDNASLLELMENDRDADRRKGR